MQWVQLFFQTGLPSRISILPRGQTEAHLPQETHALVTRNFLAWTNTGTFEMQDGAMIHGNGAKNAAADFYNEAGGTFTLVEAEGYTWYQDGPNQEQRYPKETKVYPIPEPGSEATKAATYLAAEVPLEREDNSDEESPYLIDDAVELAVFRDIVNGSNGGADYLYACAKLTDNIDLSTVCGTEIGSWTPIGLGQAKAYTGTFDGNGKTISGLYCDIFSDDEGGSTLYVGLFGAIGDGNSGEVRNLKFVRQQHQGQRLRRRHLRIQPRHHHGLHLPRHRQRQRQRQQRQRQRRREPQQRHCRRRVRD